ncbi:phosphoribosylglycinamide formyltransferase [Candidatus Saccharibacteria bacterium]|nr:phosphoribosylglycinamide formyltransferase [Candidatus Saccharibacteria bacterium]
MSKYQPKFAVLVSGSGTLADAILKAGLPVKLMVADQPCKAVDKVAPKHEVKAVVVSRQDYGYIPKKAKLDRKAFTKAVAEVLHKNKVDGAILAGWDTILDASFFTPKNFYGRVLNSHPALLPAYKGIGHAVPPQIKDKVKVSGTTIHVASADVDGQPYLFQEEVKVLRGDTVDSLHERIKVVERRLWLQAVWQWSSLIKANPNFRWPVVKP